jgi:membrane protease YdiL (CAAX protease family)
MSKNISSKSKAEQWNPLVGVLVGIVALFGSQLVIDVLIVTIVAVVKHWTTQHAINWLTNAIGAEFVFVLLSEIAAVYAVYIYVSKYKDGLSRIGIKKPVLADPLYGIAGIPAYLILYFVLLRIVLLFAPHLNTSQKQQIGFTNASGFIDLLLTFFSVVILPPIAEEIIFRGLIFTSLKNKLPLIHKTMPIWLAAIVTSCLFAAGHLTEGGSSGPLYIAAVDTFSLSIVLIYIRQKTDRLWGGMTLHAIKNLIAFIAVFVLHVS